MKRYALLLAALLAGPALAGEPISPRFNADPSPHAFKGGYYLYATDDASNSGTYWDSTTWRLYTSKDLKTWTDAGAFLGCRCSSGPSPTPRPGLRRRPIAAASTISTPRSAATRSAWPSLTAPKAPSSDAIGAPLVDKARDANAGAEPIDPQVLIDGDGQAYMVFGTRVPKIVKLGADMASLAGPIQDLVVTGFPPTIPRRSTARPRSCTSARALLFQLLDRLAGPDRLRHRQHPDGPLRLSRRDPRLSEDLDQPPGDHGGQGQELALLP
jgi:hypothetical protein